ncbi:MAG: ribosome biogenesis GTPase Der [Phycisphaerae bacterium]|nr:ribosome biogenesis GTPase Der [Phycisphaerae bacterium]
MPPFKIAIVGRPNVGKSSLINMMARSRVSIVDPTPGVTRDRVAATIRLEPPDGVSQASDVRVLEVIDTGGYGVYTAEGRRVDDAGVDLKALTDPIERQIARAIGEADLVLFVVDAQAGVTANDQAVAELLRQRRSVGKERRADTPVVVVANKVDAIRWESDAAEANGLGFGEPLMVSAKNNYRRREFLDALYGKVLELERARAGVGAARRGKKMSPAPEPDAGPGPAPGASAFPDMRLAIIGKRNAGKSSLINTLAGEERVIVSEIAGTTRDAIDVRFEMDGRALLAIDTAGLRRRKSFADRVEHFAAERAQAAIARADVVLLLVDATEPISQVDQHLAKLVEKASKPVVIVVNKWDLVEGRKITITFRGKRRRVTIDPEHYEGYLREEFKGLLFAPISFISALAGTNIRETMHLAFELFEQSRTRATTGQLNRIVRRVLEERGPASKLGTFAKVLYVAQVSVQPPKIVCVVNKPQLFTANYKRFLLNRLREELPFGEVPIELVIKARSGRDAVEHDHPDAPVRVRAKPGRAGMEVDGEEVSVSDLFEDD